MDEVVDIAAPMFSTSPTSISPTGVIQHTQPPGKSLADRMRPNSISDILGQDHLHTVLHSLGDGESLPCIILGGPHGTGKTSIARLIARGASCRFVALSTLLKSADFDIQEIIDEAKQARKFGQRTVFFVESLIGFSKSYQECLIQAIEAGYAVFIGATADNPSTDLIANLLMRCRILTLRKLQHEHLCTIMKRAISDLERGIHISLGDVPVVEVLAIEDEVIPFIATSADGDARVALNALEAAVCIAHGKLRQKRMSSLAQAEEIPLKEREKPIGVAKRENPYAKLEHLKGQIPFVQGEYSAAEAELAERRSTKNSPRLDIENALIINMVDAKEAFLRPEMLVKDRKAVEESDGADLISALLQAMRGGDSNAAVYWLVRVFEKVEQDPLRITPVLTKFASEEVGMADPQALVQAIACHQACQVIGGGKDCTSCLTQCVVYLSVARKSDALLRAFQSARKVIREAQNEPVPMHLRSSSSSSREHSCYLPPSLRNFIFLRLPDAQ
jgi:putative ATPase